ncbi:unnamed protein product, partial [Dicrocoelium dendriticum]
MLPSDRTLRDRYLRAKRRLKQIDQRDCPMERRENEIPTPTSCDYTSVYYEFGSGWCNSQLRRAFELARRHRFNSRHGHIPLRL